jgi:diaminohydroxyphosphoribosylaminopyrimidine deaminase/5-amino-6-(5-phosphoribosylamino)uracil reductase
VLGAFFDAGLADELHVYVAPLLVGGSGALSALAGVGVGRLRDALRFDSAVLRRLGGGWLLRTRITPPA